MAHNGIPTRWYNDLDANVNSSPESDSDFNLQPSTFNLQPSSFNLTSTLGGETRVYETGKAVVYDTTYSHYTKNTNSQEERIVLHIDFWYEIK